MLTMSPLQGPQPVRQQGLAVAARRLGAYSKCKRLDGLGLSLVDGMKSSPLGLGQSSRTAVKSEKPFST